VVLKKSRLLIPVIFISVLALFVVGACSKKSPMEPDPGAESMEVTTPPVEQPAVEPYEPPPPPPEPVVVEEVKEPVVMVEEVVEEIEVGDVFFDFDVYALSPEARKILANNAEILREASMVKIVVEGHCDERGTREYNLALGERRANSVKKYLVSLGISGSRIQTISYGEDRPFAMGSNEGAWSQNRRAHFVIK